MQSPATFQPSDAVFDIAGTYERAIDCANNYGLCAIDELIDLSEGTNFVFCMTYNMSGYDVLLVLRLTLLINTN